MQFNLNQPIPFLFLGDSPDSHTGLSRIGHDLAWLVSSMPEFQVGYLARQGFGRSRFPWTQYSFSAEEQWGEQRLQEAWQDLAGDRKGIIFTCWDASRLLWFADGKDTGLEAFLGSGKFEKWGYFMADASGVNPGALPLEQTHVLTQYDRVVMASEWAYRLTGFTDSMGEPDCDWIPHPINRQTFRPQDRLCIRSAWGIQDDEVLIGCVMANQARKQWPVVLQALAAMNTKLPSKPLLWIHTDMSGYWNLPGLIIEYGLQGQVLSDFRPLSDAELALRYSACDATVVISGGEGFCYPVAESLSCGVPAVTGVYGAQSELTHWLVCPTMTMIDTRHNVRRAIYNAPRVTDALLAVLEEKPSRQECEHLISYLDMPWLGIVWKKWLKRGIA